MWWHRACVTGSIGGVVLGLVSVFWSQYAVAQAQEVAVVPVTDPGTEIVLRVLATGGLPAVLGLLGYWLPHAADRMLDSLVNRVAARLETWHPVVTVKLDAREMQEIAHGINGMQALHRRVDELASELEERREAGR